MESKRRTSRTISRKRRSKNSRSRKNILTLKMILNQSSHFWYRTFTNYSLENFEKVRVLETVLTSYTQEVFPVNSLDKSSIEFEFETDCNLYLNMRDINLSLKLHYSRAGSLMLSREENQNIQRNQRMIQIGNQKFFKLCKQSNIFYFLQLKVLF